MSLQRNYYEVLGLPPGATTDQIKKKYRELARKFHPDVVQDKALGQRVFTQINQAYSVLGDPERRAQYNGTLTKSDAAPSASPSSAASPAASAPPAAPVQPLSAQKIQTAAEFMSKAENAIMASKPIEARTLCMRVLEIDPNHVRALEILGDALAQMGRRDEAAAYYRAALKVAPSTLIQAKLNRLTQTAPSARTAPPPQAPPIRNGTITNGTTGNGTQRTPPPAFNGGQRTIPPTASPAATEADKPGGLIGRLLKRK